MYSARGPGALFDTRINRGLGDVQPRAALVLDSRTPRATLLGLPDGPGAVARTLSIMKRLARDAVRDPKQVARMKAIEIYKMYRVPPRAYLREAQALQMWIQNAVRYVRDPEGVELVQTPEVTLKLGTGDCDDQSTLLAAMLIATGHTAQFVALGMNGLPLSHVLVETKIGEKWTALETIIRKPLGWLPANITSRYVRPV